MAQFNPEYAHDVLIPIAEAAYLPSLQADSLPPGYEVVGPITVSQNRVAAMAATAIRGALPPHLALVQRMRQDGDGFGWVLQNTQEHSLVAAFAARSLSKTGCMILIFCRLLTTPCRTMARCTKAFRRFTRWCAIAC